MKVCITADWHISGSRPLCRADEDWIEAQRRDIESVWEIARAEKVGAYACRGTEIALRRKAPSQLHPKDWEDQ